MAETDMAEQAFKARSKDAEPAAAVHRDEAAAPAALHVPSREERQKTFSSSVAAARPNRTGLPDGVKEGAEALSGIALDDVRVHFGSARPAALGAHAFAEGSHIHVAPGQEKHLAHEAWHVVQQKQGRVRPTRQLKGTGINDDAALEAEADRVAARILGGGQGATAGPLRMRVAAAGTAQRAKLSATPYTITLGQDFTRNHLAADEAGAMAVSIARGDHDVNTVIKGGAAAVTSAVDDSEYNDWRAYGGDPHYYQAFTLDHWAVTVAQGANGNVATITSSGEGEVTLGAYFNPGNRVNVTKVWMPGRV
jgi:hypothetical protein